jgi:hypothetical protein
MVRALPAASRARVRLGFADGSSVLLDDSAAEVDDLRSIADSLALRDAASDGD